MHLAKSWRLRHANAGASCCSNSTRNAGASAGSPPSTPHGGTAGVPPPGCVSIRSAARCHPWLCSFVPMHGSGSEVRETYVWICPVIAVASRPRRPPVLASICIAGNRGTFFGNRLMVYIKPRRCVRIGAW